MHVITVRQIPDSLYRSLSLLAQKNRRSLQQQALMLLERCRILDAQSSPMIRAQAMRDRLSKQQLGNTLQDIREERER